MARLQREAHAALAAEDVKTYMANAAIEASPSNVAEFAAFYRAEKDRWAAIIRETNAKID